MSADPSEPTIVVEPLSKIHDRGSFECGKPALDDYLARRATQDSKRGVATAFVLLHEGSPDVIGYHTLSMLSIALDELPPEVQKRLPRYPEIPAALIGRLAVHRDHQGRGLGEHLLFDAFIKIHEATRRTAACAVIMDPIDSDAQAFYEPYGFRPLAETRLFLPMATVRDLLRKADLIPRD